MKILYCGFGRAGKECLSQILVKFDVGVKDVLVFTHERDENKDFMTWLSHMGIRYHTDKLDARFEELRTFSPDYILSVYYRNIISSSVLKLAGYKTMNLHPSLLPKYRGALSSVWALLNGEEETGISFHYMNDKIDDGNIILQKRIKIEKSDTAYSLYQKLISLFVLHFSEAFTLLQSGYEGIPQEGEKSYYGRKLPYGGVRDLTGVSRSDAVRFAKAMYFPPFPGARFTQGQEVIELNTLGSIEEFERASEEI